MKNKKNNKFFLYSIFFLSILVIFLVTACGKKKNNGFEIALVIDTGTVDDKSFTQGAWDGIRKYANENNITHKYYQPIDGNENSLISNIDIAVEGGAKLVVATSSTNEVAVYKTQDKYTDIKFILVDGTPNDGKNFKTGNNTIALNFAEEESGFLAGYAAVKDGYKKIGFIGGVAVPAVVRYGYGFVEGAEFAANELGLSYGDIEIKYYYAGNFQASPENQAIAASWYNEGTELIFACGAELGNSIMSAAEVANKKVIGVDIDQSRESTSVITSALKDVKNSVYECVKKYHNGTFQGGVNLIFSAKNNGIGLEMKNSKFNNFSENDYKRIFDLLKNDKIKLIKSIDESGSPSIIKIQTVKLIEIK